MKRTSFKINNQVLVGNNAPLIFIGGPCAIETRDHSFKMAEKILKAGIKRQDGWLYYLDRRLNVYRARMDRGGEKRRKNEKKGGSNKMERGFGKPK